MASADRVDDELALHLELLERELLTASARQNAARATALLADEFREFGSSGRVYSRAEIVQLLQAELSAAITATEFSMVRLAPDAALLTYRSWRERDGQPPAWALRSSVWVRRTGNWQMLFHQGTRLP